MYLIWYAKENADLTTEWERRHIVDRKLQELVQSVHYKHHKYQMYTDPRVKAWRKIFLLAIRGQHSQLSQ